MFQLPVARTVVLLLLSEAAIIFAAYFAAFQFLESDPEFSLYLLYEGGLEQISIVIGIVLLYMYFMDMHSRFIRSRIELVYLIVSAFGIAFIAEALLSYLWRPFSIRSSYMMLGAGIAIVGLVAWRIVYTRYVRHMVGSESVVFVGNNPLIQEITTEILGRPELGISILGYISNDAAETIPIPEKHLGPIDTLQSQIHRLQPNKIVVGFTDRRGQLPVYELLALRFAGFVIQEAATMFEVTCSRLSLWALRPSDLIFSGRLSPRRRTEIVHTITDVVVAGIGALLLLPVIVAVALAVKLTSHGPLFYVQKRIGMNGKPFDMLKFRTMDEPADGSHEPRLTSIGNVLRKSRLNELPQLLNVLKREMSIVGPRPERPEYVAVFVESIPFYGHRHSVRPGITGWAQINYKHADSVEDAVRKLEYDLYYIKNMSNALDVYIIFNTVKTVFLAHDAG